MKISPQAPPSSGREPGRLRRPVKRLNNSASPEDSAVEVSGKGNDAYWSLLEKSPLGIVLFKRDGSYLYVNPAFEKMFGYSLQDVPTGKTWFRKAYPNKKYRSKVIDTWKQFFEKNGTGVIHPVIFRVRCKDGSEKYVHFFRQVIVEEDRVLVFCADVTDRQQAMQDLRRSRERYRQIVETANEGIWVVDEKLRTTFVNDQLSRMLGYHQEAMLGRPLADFLFPEDLVNHRQRMRSRRRGENDFYERRFRRQDGQVCWCQISATALKDETGRFAGAFGMLSDITQRKNMEEALMQSEEKFRLLSGQLIRAQESERKRIAVELHDEVGQTLVGLKFQLTNVRKKLRPDQENLLGEVEQIFRSIDEMTVSIRRLSKDLRPAVLEHLGLGEALQWLFDDFSKKSKVSLRYDAPLPSFSFPHERDIMVFRIFQEALANIGKHSRASLIVIAVAKNEKGGVFSIRDNGVGFDMERIRRRPLDEKGLGLTTMQERAQLAGGTLEVRSAVGQGTGIFFNIPFN